MEYFQGKTIFITGATGFLAKVLVEKILRVQPKIKKLYLLIRTPTNISIQQRLQEEVVGTEIFRILRKKCGGEFHSHISSKVTAVSGDVGQENLGITDSELRQIMWQEIDIIVNSAATTNFFERYDVAFGINALGAMHVRDFAAKCCKLQTLLQVSTAFVHGTQAGVIAERPLNMGDTLPGAKITFLDMDYENKIIQDKLRALQNQNATEKEIGRAMKDLGIQRATLHGWPNTYVFTKAMGEMMLDKFNHKANVVILRPTIITGTIADPFPGWIEGVRTLDAIFVAYGKGKLKFFLGDPNSTLDMIPGDMVVNSMIAAMASHSNVKNELVVYHVGSSTQNPITLGQVKILMNLYLTKNPLVDSSGNPIKVGKPMMMDTIPKFHNYIRLHYKPFLKILKWINVLCWNRFEGAYVNAKRRVDTALRLAEIYKPYLFSKAIFDDGNRKKLEEDVKGSMLNFDPKSINWDDYLINTHFKGLSTYVLN